MHLRIQKEMKHDVSSMNSLSIIFLTYLSNICVDESELDVEYETSFSLSEITASLPRKCKSEYIPVGSVNLEYLRCPLNVLFTRLHV